MGSFTVFWELIWDIISRFCRTYYNLFFFYIWNQLAYIVDFHVKNLKNFFPKFFNFEIHLKERKKEQI